MKHLLILPFTLLIIFPAIADTPTQITFPKIHVLNPDGTPLPDAQAAVRKTDHIPYFIDGWYDADNTGHIHIDVDRAKGHWYSDIPEGNYQVMIRHAGYAPTHLTVDIPTTQTSLTALMIPGHLAQIQLKPYGDTTLPPDLRPIIADFPLSATVVNSFVPESEYNHLGQPLHLYDVSKTADNTFTVRVSQKLTHPLQVAINHPSYLANYISREITPEEILSGTTTLELPTPGSIALDIQLQETTSTEVFELTHITAGIINDSTLPIVTTGSRSISKILHGVLPGEYQYHVRAPLANPNKDPDKFNYYVDSEYAHYDKSVKVTTGAQTKNELRIPQLPKTWFDGDGSATLTFKSATGRSIAGQPYLLHGLIDDYSYVPIRTGTVPDNQILEFQNLRRDDIHYYELRIGKIHSSIITFREKSHVTSTRYIAPLKGDTAPEIEAWDLNTSAPLSLADLRGKVVVLDFWATWCGPCQPSMQKLADISRSLPDDLKDKVALITISVDETPDEVKKHLAENNWNDTGVTHYWYGPGSPSARGGPYGVTGIPHTVIIDPQGKILEPNTSISDTLVETLRQAAR